MPKSAVIPQVRVEPQLRAELEAVLHDGESLSGFVEQSVRDAVAWRLAQAAFHARGDAAWADVAAGGASSPAGEVLARLQRRVDARRRQLGG